MSSQPAYVWAMVLAGVLGIPAVATVGLYRGARSSGRSSGTAWAAAGGFAAVWTAWIGASSVLADHSAYAQTPGVNRPWVGLAAGGALLVALGGATIPGIRAAIGAPGGMARLTWPHTLRAVGVIFIIAMALGTLPAVFALPAGLASGDYPYPLKQRIAGKQGHLDNGAAAALLARLDNSRLKHLFAAHLSQHNNRPDLARAALAGALNCTPDWVGIADQREGFAWREFVS